MENSDNDLPQEWAQNTIETQLLDPSFYDFNFSPTTFDALCQLFPEDGHNQGQNSHLNQQAQTTTHQEQLLQLETFSTVQEQRTIEQAQLAQLEASLDQQMQKIVAQQQRISELETTVESMASQLDSIQRYLKNDLAVWNREVTEALQTLKVPMSATRSEFEIEGKE